MEFFILAQSTDPISGGAGWVGAGLLGLVLGWLLLKHLPDKDRQQTAQLDRHLAVEESQRQYHGKIEKEQRDEYRTTLGSVLDSHRVQIEVMTKALSTDLQALRQAVDALRDLVEEKLR